MATMHDLEVRVLEGLHQGAQASLDPALEAYSVGKTTDFDIVLKDLPVDSGEITISEQLWTWRDRDFEITVPWGEAVSLDGVVIQVCQRSDPWPASPDGPVRHPRHVGESQAPNHTEESPGHGLTTQEHDQANRTDASQDPEQGPTSAPSRTSKVSIGIAALVTVVIVTAGAWVIMGPFHQDAPSSNAVQVIENPAKTQANQEADLQAITALIDEMALLDRVEAIPNESTGRIEIFGVMADDKEFEEFVRNVRKVTSRVLLRIVSHRDFAIDVRGLQQDLPEGVKISTEPIGIIVLEGSIDTDEAREALVERIKNLAPMAAEINVRLRTKSELAAEARDKRRAGRDAATALPDVMSVVSGPEPFLVLQNGDRVMVGGVVSGHMLTAISASHIEYRNPEGKTILVPR